VPPQECATTADSLEPFPAATADEALLLCRRHGPDVLVVGLEPDDDAGRELLRRIRGGEWLETQVDPYPPIIVLHPRGAEEEGPEAGLAADDYLIKPFAYEDLRGRIWAILRRRHRRLDEPVRVGEIYIDLGRRKVVVGGREVHLAKKEFTLPRVLAADPTRVFAKDELLRDIWGLREPATTRTLDSHASRLRRRLDPEHRRYVVNCWGIGYRLVDS
jgi:DNA-binding response OmpR family regulator